MRNKQNADFPQTRKVITIVRDTVMICPLSFVKFHEYLGFISSNISSLLKVKISNNVVKSAKEVHAHKF